MQMDIFIEFALV